MIQVFPTRDLHPNWLVGSGISAGDTYYHVPGRFVHLCLAADRETTWVFTGELPDSMAEAVRLVGGRERDE